MRRPVQTGGAAGRELTMATVRFSASGYGTEKQRYPDRGQAVASAEREAAEMAADHGLGAENVVRLGDEWILESDSGEEIARWEVLP